MTGKRFLLLGVRRGQRLLPLRRAVGRLRLLVFPILILFVGCDSFSGPDGDEDAGEPFDNTCLLPPFAAASITLDGLVDDWAGVDPLALDEQGDDSPLFTGDDLRAVYVAQSSQDLFVRVDLWETVNTNFGNGPVDEEYGRYNIVIENVGSFPRIDLGIAFDVDAGGWSVGHNGASSQVPDGLEGPTFVAVVESVIEFGVPLGLIGNPSGYTEVQAEALTTDAVQLDEVGQACVAS